MERAGMTTYHDNKHPASESEAMQAILSGLTPARVQLAVLTATRAETAGEHGFERNAIARLALRWGILTGGNEH